MIPFTIASLSLATRGIYLARQIDEHTHERNIPALTGLGSNAVALGSKLSVAEPM